MVGTVREEASKSVGRDVRPAPFLRRNVRERLRKRPLVACNVLGVVLPLAVLEIGRLHEDACPVFPRPLAVGAGVLHAHCYGVGDLAGARRAAVVPYITDDHGTVADPEL